MSVLQKLNLYLSDFIFYFIICPFAIYWAVEVEIFEVWMFLYFPIAFHF